jgi:hypothetical protein
MKNNLIGNRFLADLGSFKSELFFESDDSLIFKIVEGGGPGEPGHTEKVQITVAEVRPQVYMVAWKEATTTVFFDQSYIIFTWFTLSLAS